MSYGGRRKKAIRRTLHRVLNRCTREQQAVPAVETEEGLPTSTGRVLDVLRLVENHVLPLHALEVLLVLGNLGTDEYAFTDVRV